MVFNNRRACLLTLKNKDSCVRGPISSELGLKGSKWGR